jgi:ribosomal protein L31E
MVEDMVFRNVRAALALPEIVASVSRLTNLTPADVSRELGDGVWKGLGNGVKQRLLASIVKEAVVHEDRVEITLNTAGFAPLMQEVWNESAKD